MLEEFIAVTAVSSGEWIESMVVICMAETRMTKRVHYLLKLECTILFKKKILSNVTL